MFKLVKNGRKSRLTFKTYEQARQYARKLIRKGKAQPNGIYAFDFWTSNPQIGDFGLRIVRV